MDGETQQQLRLRIYEATIEEFREKGFKFTMDDMARRLGVSKKTIYQVVRDKETLFFDTATLRHAHEIAEEVHEGIEKNFPKVKHVMVHVNPADAS